MKAILGLLTASLLLGGTVSAQTSLSLPAANESIVASFYDGNPYDGGALVDSNVTVKLTDSTIGKVIHLEDDASYIMLNIGGSELVFETWGITSTNTTSIKNVNDGEALSLGDVTQAIYDAAQGEKELAIFTDSEGVVTGFYSHYLGVDTNIDVSEADFLIIASADQSQVYETSNPGATKLSNVTVSVDGQSVALSRLVEL